MRSGKFFSPSRGNGEGIAAVRDFSGLVSSAWALARAAAIAPIDSLDRCMVHLQIHQVKTDGAGFRAFGPQAMADGFLGIFRNQFLEIGLDAFMFLKGGTGPSKGSCEFCPAVGSGHIDDADRRQPWSWRFDPEQPRRFTALDAVPDLFLGGGQQMLIERLDMNGELALFAAAGDDRQHRRS